MKLAILDPGFSHLGTHHESVNLGIVCGLSKKGIQSVVFTSENLRPTVNPETSLYQMNVIPFFKTLCYLPENVPFTQRGYDALVHSFFLELESLFESPHMEDVNLIYLHTGYSFHLQGLGKALNNSRLKTLNRLIISLMFFPESPAHQNRLNEEDVQEYLCYKTALNVLAEASQKSKISIDVATSCRTFQTTYQKLWSLGPVDIHPAINQYSRFQSLKEPQLASDRVLLYLGAPKTDKGIEFITEICQITSEKFPETQFVIQMNLSFPGFSSEFGGLITKLRKASEISHNITLKEDYLEPDSYYSLLNSCSVITLLYQPTKYKFKTSGIFWDGLLLKKDKWLVSRDTWIADELSELQIPFQSVEYGDVSSALSGLEKLINHPSIHVMKKLDNTVPESKYLKQLTSSFSDWLFSKAMQSTINIEEGFS